MGSTAAVRPVRKPSSRYHHGDLRRALVAEAVRTIGSGGVDALTLREVGARLGVSRTALYRHFADKSALLAAVAREGFQQFTTDLQAGWEEAPGTLRGLEQMGRAYVRFAQAHPAHYRVMFGGFAHLIDSDPELQADAGASFQVLVDALAVLQASRLVRRDELVVQARYVWAIVHGISTLAIDGQLGPADEATLGPLMELALHRMRTGIAVVRTRER
jgi:AcrR family transcriptional regulator